MQKKILIGLALTLIIVIFIALYWATEPGRQEAAGERQQAEAIERGAELYTLQCATCHGLTGEGKIGPALKGTQLDGDTLGKIIARGIPGSAMPAMGEEDGGPLKEHQIKDLITFLENWDQSLIESPPAPTPTPTSTPAPTPSPTPAPTASAINASELFAAKCSVCHGANRQGVSGLGPPLIPQSLAALSDTEIRDTILRGRLTAGMPSFENLLKHEEINALLQFIKYTAP